jgi:pimeloyl-ACP methyl ester carboxylesterase
MRRSRHDHRWRWVPRLTGAVGVGLAVVVATALLAGCTGSDDATSGTPATAGSSDAMGGSPAASPAPSSAPADCPELVFRDPEFAFELRRTMSAIYAGEADLGECLATASRIKDGDFESWYREWYATAEHFRRVGDRAVKAGHQVTARDAYYRAATYYRTGEFFLHGDPDDPRIVATWRKGRDSFVAAAELDPRPFERVKIPYDDTTLPGYFYRTEEAADGETPPLLIVQTGFDGCQEELHPYAVAAVERGYNVLTFEGPGQGEVIRVQGLGFRHDWEHVVEQVVDYLIGHTDVDPDRIALWGISLGGYLAPRAAAFDHRLAACIADGAMFDVGEVLLAGLEKGGAVPAGMTVKELREYLESDPPQYNKAIREEMKASTTARWQNEHGMYVFKAGSPALFWADFTAFSLRGAAEKIICPTLVCWGGADSFDPGGRQAKQLYRQLTCPKTLMGFTQRYEAGDHCQLGAFALSFGRKFDWLDTVMRPRQ